MTRTRPSGAIRRTVALISGVAAAAAFLEWLSSLAADWRTAIPSCLAFSLRFAVALD
jgi:hypothetical protein